MTAPITLASAPASLASLPAGTALTAVVQQVLDAGRRYQVDIRGLLLELEMDLLLQVGQRVPLRVAESSPRGLVLTAAPPAPELPRAEAPLPPALPAEEAVRAAGLPVRDDTLRAARALEAVGGRLAPDPLAATAEAIRALPPPEPTVAPSAAPPPPPADLAAAYLVSRGLPPAPELVRSLAPAFASEPPPVPVPRPDAPAAPPPSMPAPAPVDLPRAVESGTLPQRLQEAAAQAAGAPEALRRVVERALAATPLLALLDAAIQEVEARLAVPPSAPPAPADEALVRDLLARLAALPDAEEARRLVRELPAAPALLARLRETLLRTELDEIAKRPELRALREGPSRPEPAERAAAVRILNTVAAAQAEGITVVEVPLRAAEGGRPSRALVIFRRSGRQGAGFEGFDSFTVDVLMSRLGRVIGQIGLTRRSASVRFRVRGPAEAKLFETNAPELVEALGALGLEAGVSVAVRGAGSETPSLADGLRQEATGSVDLTA